MVLMRRKERFELLRVASDEGYPALTIELAKLYLAQFPDDAWALIYFGMALQDLARYNEARSAFNSSLAVMPPENHERLYRQLGLLSQDESQFEEAEHWFRKALQARPDDATAYIYLGAMLAKSGHLEEAETWHRRAVACPEGCIDEAYLNLGYVLRAKEEYLEALECFREAVRRDPLYEAAQEALEDMEQVLFRFPEA
jgi:tetratricopeptide (TPR) repeat protein